MLKILQGIHQCQYNEKNIKTFPFFKSLIVNFEENEIEYEISSFFIEKKEKYILPLLEKLKKRERERKLKDKRRKYKNA